MIRCNELEKAAKDLNSKFKEQGKTIEKLNRQLEDLITAKNEHENSLLEKFRDLLNAKKLKIRDLHRALAAAKVEPQDGTPYCLLASLCKGKNPSLEANILF